MQMTLDILNANPDLFPYICLVYEDVDSDSPITFNCFAEDDEHAIKQTYNAYPDGTVVSVFIIVN